MASAKTKRVPDYGRPKRREIGFVEYINNFINKLKKR